MRRRVLKVDGDSDSRVEDDNVGSEGQGKAGEGWETYVWRQDSNPRPEITRKEEVGEILTPHNENRKHWNSRVGRCPSASVTSGPQDAQKKREHAQRVHALPTAIVQLCAVERACYLGTRYGNRNGF